jgi:sugar/nucleoside kinase (ribokinase family)
LSASVLVLGDALLDVTARPATPILVGADVPAEVRIGCGGQGANLAIRLARQGVGVTLICGLGNDPAASLVTDALRAEGVRLDPVRVDATGAVVILIDDVGERTMLSQRAPFTAATFSAPSWTVISGYLLLQADGIDLARVVADRTSRLVVVGCAVPEPSRSAWRRAVAAARADVLILNREEAAAMAPIAELGTGTIVTAPDSIAAVIGEASVSVRVPEGKPAIDTTGAGDAFAAATVAALIRAPWPPSGAALESIIADAARLAGEVARTPGAQARVAAEARA